MSYRLDVIYLSLEYDLFLWKQDLFFYWCGHRMDYLKTVRENERWGLMLYIMIFNCERTHSCFMCDRLWRLRVWTQLIVLIQYSIRKSCYLPVSIHDCCCVAWSLHINGRWCIYTHPLNVIALTSGVYVTFPVFVPVSFCVSRVTDLHPREGDM